MPPGFVISAPASGTGKTTLALALARAFSQRGLRVQCFKCGPDYIDPAFHAAASGRQSYNIDSWSMSQTRIAAVAARASGCDLVIAEGAMGLFDGTASAGACGHGSSADIAALMQWPVVLVIDPSGQAQTAAAVAAGLKHFRRGVHVAGVILNRVASPRHESLVRDGMAEAGIPVFGALPRQSQIALPERHLGLVQAEEHASLETLIDDASHLVAERVDLDALYDVARSSLDSSLPAPISPARSLPPPGQRIALARDAAFSFIYPHLLDAWRDAGSEIVSFSPLADEGPRDDCDVCWLPGGYPELHAAQITSAENFMITMRSFAQTRPVHGECGGYMVMGQGLVSADGTRHEMLGLLGLETSFAKRKLHLGYRVAELLAPAPGHCAGSRLRGHEFHYATVLSQPDAPLTRAVDATGAPVAEAGSVRGRATGSFFHFLDTEA
ncbi:MAG: cobyrinate a,c-diamide synthase [Hyphomicrobium sp.]|nr:cobyrinate a,c-diamide synthase [Hyphomicrobium sp.]